MDTHFPSPDSANTADPFLALEQKVMRAVEVLRRERAARLAAEAEATRLREQLAQDRRAHEEMSAGVEEELEALRRERTEVRQRVATMLDQMDELL